MSGLSCPLRGNQFSLGPACYICSYDVICKCVCFPAPVGSRLSGSRLGREAADTLPAGSGAVCPLDYIPLSVRGRHARPRSAGRPAGPACRPPQSGRPPRHSPGETDRLPYAGSRGQSDSLCRDQRPTTCLMSATETNQLAYAGIRGRPAALCREQRRIS